MPLNYEQGKTRQQKLARKVGNLFLQIVALIRPETILGVFLLAAIIFSSLKIKAWGFFVVFGIFIIGWFAERIIKIWKKKLISTKNNE